ncbi:choice-of-anchor Q domain-containing protein [Niabella drilacis]|uniref:Polymorphic outer membrane protein repeat-containing protein n=1 Tax=Niabella drilacis (strain DSM 25811 / CCM 8410 / CCUG 62505 / LMG 26954 / E90) TaxID=1285928 RepID=A0A1G6NG95_NIADE|nr:choice-of-anchor Q domain-containing protein [Niabella drilacis]SDC66135.1 hypothetical protein SAMN04487894_103245 [Niabella drilacis]
MKKQYLLFLLLLVLPASLLNAQALYVDATATGANDGSSWTNAYKSLASALNAANANPAITQVQVAQGNYYPTGDNAGTGRNAAFRITRNNLQLLGGYPSGGGVRNALTNITTLNGDIGTAGNNSDNSYHVVLVTNITGGVSTVLVDGFTIQNGNASDSYTGATGRGGGIYLSQNESHTVTINNCILTSNFAGLGGGIYMEGAAGADMPTSNASLVSNCLFQNNTAYIYGGGASSRNCAPSFVACTFNNNQTLANTIGAAGGGAIENRNCTPSYINCIIMNNTASDGNGGGLYTRHSKVRISGCLFENNRALEGSRSNGDGGAIFDADYDASQYGPYPSQNTIIHTKFIRNKAAGDGGAMYNLFSNATASNCLFLKDTAAHGSAVNMEANSGAGIVITNSTVYGNYSPGAAGGVLSMFGSGSFLRIHNSIVWNNNTGIVAEPAAGMPYSYSLVQGQSNTGNGNLSPAGIPDDGSTIFGNIAADDYSLAINSPVIDRGANGLYDAATFGNNDLAGNPRFMGTAIDMGTYEQVDAAMPVHFGALSAVMQKDQLTVNWTTQTETNNDHFDIEASTDGARFKKLATVLSKTPNGNSSIALEYSFSIHDAMTTVLFGGIAGVFLLCLGFEGHKRRTKGVPGLFIAVAVLTYSCSKNEPLQDANHTRIYLRIAQVDKDGKKEYSKAIQVVRE